MSQPITIGNQHFLSCEPQAASVALLSDRSTYKEITRKQLSYYQRKAKKQVEDAQRAAEHAEYVRTNPLYENPQPKYAQTYYTPTRIKSELGWTDKLIDNFLGEPDHTAPNPHHRSGSEMRLYLTTRIAAVESTPEFHTAYGAAQVRKVAASKATITRSENMADRMREAEITIKPGLTQDEIYDLAIRTHGGNYAGHPGDFHWSNGKAINCIRHNLTNYEELWMLCNRGETGQDAYDTLRSRVDALIQETYPEYFID